MSWPPLLYLLPHALALIVQATVASYAFRRHRVPGAMLFALVVLSQAWWTLGYVLELGTPSLEGKIFWDNLQFIGAGAWTLCFFAFGLQYTHTRLRGSRWVWFANSLVLGGYCVLLFTDPAHGLIRPRVELVEEGGVRALVYPFTPLTWAVVLYAFALFGVTIWLLLGHAWKARAPYRAQALAVVVGTLVPLAGALSTMLGLFEDAFRDTSPLTFAVGNVIIAWGLFRFRFLDLVPVARDIVFDNLRDLVTVLDDRGRVIDGNPALFQALRMSRTEALGRPAREVFAAWGDLVERFRTLEDARSVIVAEVAGVPRQLELSLTTMRDDRGRKLGRIFVCHDVTELKETQRTLELKNEELRAINEELDAFSYSVSHDLRAPARVMAGFSKRLLERSAGELDADAIKLLQRIQANAERMQALIDDLLAFARLGRKALERREVDPTGIARQVIAELDVETSGRSIQFQVDELPPASADPSLLRQVFANLIGNAVKFTRSRERAVIRVGASTEDGETVYFVADNGVGFEMQGAEQLFGVFQRLHGAEEFEGTGIGLASSKRIVVKHGGRIWAKAKPGEGATFYFTLAPP